MPSGLLASRFAGILTRAPSPRSACFRGTLTALPLFRLGALGLLGAALGACESSPRPSASLADVPGSDLPVRAGLAGRLTPTQHHNIALDVLGVDLGEARALEAAGAGIPQEQPSTGLFRNGADGQAAADDYPLAFGKLAAAIAERVDIAALDGQLSRRARTRRGVRARLRGRSSASACFADRLSTARSATPSSPCTPSVLAEGARASSSARAASSKPCCSRPRSCFDSNASSAEQRAKSATSTASSWRRAFRSSCGIQRLMTSCSRWPTSGTLERLAGRTARAAAAGAALARGSSRAAHDTGARPRLRRHRTRRFRRRHARAPLVSARVDGRYGRPASVARAGQDSRACSRPRA